MTTYLVLSNYLKDTDGSHKNSNYSFKNDLPECYHFFIKNCSTMTHVLTAHRKLTCRLSNTFRLTFEAVLMMLHNPSGKQDTKPFGKSVIAFTSTLLRTSACDILAQ